MLLGAALIGLSALCMRRRRLQIEAGELAGPRTLAHRVCLLARCYRFVVTSLTVDRRSSPARAKAGAAGGGNGAKPRQGKNPKHRLPTADMDEGYEMEDGVGNGEGGGGNGAASSPGGKSDSGLREEGMD